MAGELENNGGEQSTGVETGTEQQTSGQEGAEQTAQQIDTQEFERIRGEHQTLLQNWQKLSEIANRDEVVRRELERAWKGLPPQQQAQIAKQQQAQQDRPANQSKKEIDEIKQQLKEWKEAQETQQREVLRREKLNEVQSETERVFKEFEANPADQQEFWKRYGDMINREAQQLMAQGLDPRAAQQRAQWNHSFNLAGEYALLMRDKVADVWSKKAAERNNPLRGIATPADKQGAPGVDPTVRDKFFNTIKNERNAERRAQMYVDYAKQTGISVDDLFRGRGGA